MAYPDDADGDALRRLEANGDDLSHARAVEFSVVFPNENTADQFAEHFRAIGYEASVELVATVEEFPWEVVVMNYMVPSHDEIGDFEDMLQSVAKALGGRNDGWGCFSERSSPL